MFNIKIQHNLLKITTYKKNIFCLKIFTNSIFTKFYIQFDYLFSYGQFSAAMKIDGCEVIHFSTLLTPSTQTVCKL